MENGLENRMDNGMEKKIAMVHGAEAVPLPN